MSTPKFKSIDKVVIALFFLFYMFGYHKLISSDGDESKEKTEEVITEEPQTARQERGMPIDERQMREVRSWGI